jgi:hypothetical protein
MYVLSDDAVESERSAPLSPLWAALQVGLCGLLCRWILCALCVLSTELSIIKMKTTLANVNPTASATPLCMLCSISDDLCNLCLSGCPLSLLDG